MAITSLNGDICGGAIEAGLQTFVTWQGILVAVVGDRVAPHGPGIHSNAVMQTGSAFVTINGIPVCRYGDRATCGHTVSTITSNWDISA